MKILIIEDDIDLAQVIKKSLLSEGHEAVVCSNGKDGLYVATFQEVDLIILDIMLPELDGWQILGSLRKKKTTPVIILTARDGIEDRVRGLDEGADDFLMKPFHVDELRARVDALLRRSIIGAKEKIQITKEIVFDTKKQTLYQNETAMNFTGKEIHFLKLLVEAKGGIVSRETIYERLFDDLEDQENVIEVYIYKLRKKLGRKTIETVRGIGYRLLIEQIK